MEYIKVWCEYDFGGGFGGNNNEDVFAVSEKLSNEEISSLVLKFLCKVTDLDTDELDGLYGWDFITITKLK